MTIGKMLAGMLLVGCGLFGHSAWAGDDDARICASGKAEREVKPDVALVLLYLSTDGVLMVDAEKDFREKFTKLEKVLKEGCKEIKSIDTRIVSLGQKFTGWNPQCTNKAQPEIRKQIIVTIPPDPKIATAIIDIAIRNDATLSPQSNANYGGQLNSVIIYGVNDYAKIEKEVQVEAIAEMKKNADSIADMIGRKIKKMTEISNCHQVNFQHVYINGINFNLPLKYYSVDADKVKVSASFNGKFELKD